MNGVQGKKNGIYVVAKMEQMYVVAKMEQMDNLRLSVLPPI